MSSRYVCFPFPTDWERRHAHDEFVAGEPQNTIDFLCNRSDFKEFATRRRWFCNVCNCNRNWQENRTINIASQFSLPRRICSACIGKRRIEEDSRHVRKNYRKGSLGCSADLWSMKSVATATNDRQYSWILNMVASPYSSLFVSPRRLVVPRTSRRSVGWWSLYNVYASSSPHVAPCWGRWCT